MSKKTGALIKEARTNAGFTQQQLADKIKGLSATDISKAERGEADLTTEQLKSIAKLTGITQKSLLDTVSKTSTAKKTSSAKTSTAKTTSAKTTAKKTTAKKTATPANANTSMKVTTTEKKLVELYREADSTAKKNAMKLLKGEELDSADAGDIISSLLGNLGKKDDSEGDANGLLTSLIGSLGKSDGKKDDNAISSLLGTAMESLLKK